MVTVLGIPFIAGVLITVLCLLARKKRRSKNHAAKKTSGNGEQGRKPSGRHSIHTSTSSHYTTADNDIVAIPTLKKTSKGAKYREERKRSSLISYYSTYTSMFPDR